MRRRTFIVLAMLFALLGSIALIGIGAAQGPRKKVVIATLLSHPALDQIIVSLREEMTRRGYVEGRDVTYIVRNASGNMQVVATIAEEVTSLNPDAIVPITTPMSQAVVKVARVPVVFSAVTDPVGAGIVKNLESPGDRITGVSDAWPYEDQLRLLKEIAPKAVTVGVLYNPGEAASQYGIRQIREIAPRLGLRLAEGAVSAPSEVATVAESLIDRVDALYLSSDATVISGFAAASKVSFRAKKPLIVGDSGTVEKGGLAAVSVGYAGVGKETGRLLDLVLRGQKNIAVVVAKGDEIFLNTKAAELTGITFSPELKRKATKIFETIP